MKKLILSVASIFAVVLSQAQIDRWYNYVDDVLPDNINACISSIADDYNWSKINLWSDTTSLWVNNSTGPAYLNTAWVSYGLGLHPFSPAWNDPFKFTGKMMVRNTDPYTIDSINIAAVYGRNPAKPYVDTLIVTFVDGDGSSTADLALGLTSPPADYCVITAPYFTMYHDSLTNSAGQSTAAITVPVPAPIPCTAATHVYRFLLNPSDSTNIMLAGTGPTGTTNMKFPRAGHFPPDPVISYSVAPGHIASASISFKSGDSTYPATYIGASGFKDTVQYVPASTGAYAPYKHSGFSPYIRYAVGVVGGTSPAFPGFVANSGPTMPDWTSGYFKRLGARDAGSVNRFSVNWELKNSTSASSLQYPYVSYHVRCTTCIFVTPHPAEILEKNNISGIVVCPNPADDKLSISFTATYSGAMVSLTNIIGKEMASQKVTNGLAVFNTSALATGMYIYTIQGCGERATGRVFVSH